MRWLGWVLCAACVTGNPWQQQREYLEAQKPKTLEQTTAPAAQSTVPVRKLKVRAWVDSDYRGQQLHWDSHVRALFDRASAFMRGPFGVELEVVAVTAWDRPGGASRIEPIVEQLAQQDPGNDVDLVVGFVSALSVFSATYHDLGAANLPGRHIVLRGIDNAAETDAIMGSLKLLGDDEKLPVLRARKEHKETAVFLHEWGHALGAFHDRGTDGLMGVLYAPSHGRFTPLSERIISIGLKHHPLGLNDVEERKRWVAEVEPVVAPLGENQFAMGERESSLAWMKGQVTRRPLAEVDRKLLNIAIDKLNAGRASDALSTVLPLAERYPKDDKVRAIVCVSAERASDARAPELCRAACEEAKVAVACMRLAEAELKVDPAKGRARLHALEETLDDRALWTELAFTWRRAACPTWAERAAAHAELSAQASEVTEWARRTRRWLCLEGTSPEDEADLLVEFQAQRIPKRFPKAALTKAMECEKALRAGNSTAARAACEQALAIDADCGIAHYLVAVAHGAQSRFADAAKHLELALEIEPGNDDGWSRLIEAYRRTGNAAGVESATKRREEHRQQSASFR